MEKIISYMGRTTKVACDEKCEKAWGLQNRPSQKLSDDDDDIVWLADDELDDAPINPKTYEGGEAKPVNKVGIPNKWCVRECERCAMNNIGKLHEPLELKNWNKRLYNQPWKHQNI